MTTIGRFLQRIRNTKPLEEINMPEFEPVICRPVEYTIPKKNTNANVQVFIGDCWVQFSFPIEHETPTKETEEKARVLFAAIRSNFREEPTDLTRFDVCVNSSPRYPHFELIDGKPSGSIEVKTFHSVEKQNTQINDL